MESCLCTSYIILMVAGIISNLTIIFTFLSGNVSNIRCLRSISIINSHHFLKTNAPILQNGVQLTFAPLTWIIDNLPFIASANSLQLYNWILLVLSMSGKICNCVYCNKYFSSGDIVHAECTDPEPLHCRHSADSIQHAPHFHRIKQALLGELLHRIGKKQQLLTNKK